MLQFNELRISPDGKYLIIDILVQDLSYYTDVFIDYILIETLNTFNSSGPSGKYFLRKDNLNTKHYRNYIDIADTGLLIFFVYVGTSGNYAEDTPCGMKDTMIMGVTYNKEPLYLLSMKMLSSMQGCEPSADLIDFILQQKAFDISLQTGDYSKALQYWDMFFKESKTNVKPGCGCYG